MAGILKSAEVSFVCQLQPAERGCIVGTNKKSSEEIEMALRGESKAGRKDEPPLGHESSTASRGPRWWMYCIHRQPKAEAHLVWPSDRPFDAYDGSFQFFRAMAPAVWLALVGLSTFGMLYAVGYLSIAEPPALLEKITAAVQGPIDITARRAALAYSGVTLAITVALSLTSLVWAIAAFRGKAPSYRWPILVWVIFALVLSLGILGWIAHQPFASELGKKLLEDPVPPELRAPGSSWVPDMMFGLACVVPSILAAGAGFLLQPMRQPADLEGVKPQLRILAGRLKELDQLLYVGALALVFGTLQLSAALSVPLASLPKASDLKSQADLCKTLAPSPASSPFFTASVATSASGSSAHEVFDLRHCQGLPREFARGNVADGLRQLIRGVTLSVGLAFSALLAAIYVPALIGLRLMIEPLQGRIDASSDGTKDEKSDIGDIDPLRRVAAVAATLSPLIAGLLANALATG